MFSTAQPAWKKYKVSIIHRVYDWDSSFTMQAPDAKTARKWAMLKLAHPHMWLAVKAEQVKPNKEAANG